MKIYFDGCSFTAGNELIDRKKTRFSRLICNELSAIECNFARAGGSNRRIVRNLIEKDLSSYDMFIIQFTKNNRTEYYDGIDWVRVKYPVRYQSTNGRKIRGEFRGRMNEFWEKYYETYYHDRYGVLDREICHNAVINLIHGKKYFIFDIDKCIEVMGDNKAKGSHPNEKGHELIAKYILDNI